MGLACLGSPTTWHSAQPTWRIENIPSALQCWSTDEDQAGYGEGSRPRGGGRRRGGGRVGRWLGTHRGPLGPARVRGPHCGSAEPVPVSLARLLWLPERQLAGRVGPIFSDSTLPPARRPVTGSGLGTLDLEPRQGGTQPEQGS